MIWSFQKNLPAWLVQVNEISNYFEKYFVVVQRPFRWFKEKLQFYVLKTHSCTSLCWSTDGKFQSHQYDYGNIIRLQNPSLPMVASRARTLKGSPDQSYFIFEINVGKSRFRHITTLGRDPRIARSADPAILVSPPF